MRNVLSSVLCVVTIAFSANLRADDPLLVPLEGTRWACVDGKSMHWGIRFQENGVAIIDAPGPETLEAKWGRNGNKLAYSVVTGFEARVGEVDPSGRTMKGTDMITGNLNQSHQGQWTGTRIDPITSEMNRPPILYSGEQLLFSREEMESMGGTGKSFNLVLKFKILATGRVSDVEVPEGTPSALGKKIHRIAESWVFLPRVVKGFEKESTVKMPFNVTITMHEEAQRATKPFGGAKPAEDKGSPGKSP